MSEFLVSRALRRMAAPGYTGFQDEHGRMHYTRIANPFLRWFDIVIEWVRASMKPPHAANLPHCQAT